MAGSAQSLSGVAVEETSRAKLENFLKANPGTKGHTETWMTFRVDETLSDKPIVLTNHGSDQDPYDAAIADLIEKPCGYSVMYFTTRHKKGEESCPDNSLFPVLLKWVNDDMATVKQKMLCATSFKAIQQVVTNKAKATLEWSDMGDLKRSSMFDEIKKNTRSAATS